MVPWPLKGQDELPKALPTPSSVLILTRDNREPQYSQSELLADQSGSYLCTGQVISQGTFQAFCQAHLSTPKTVPVPGEGLAIRG